MTDAWPQVWLYVDSGNLNLGPHACEPFPSLVLSHSFYDVLIVHFVIASLIAQYKLQDEVA